MGSVNHKLSETVLHILFRTLLIALLSILGGIGLPWIVASHNEVLYEQDFLRTLSGSSQPDGTSCSQDSPILGVLDRSQTARSKVAQVIVERNCAAPRIQWLFLQQIRELAKESTTLDDQLKRVDLLQKLATLKEKVKSTLVGSIYVGRPYHMAITKFIWPAVYMSIGWLIWVFPLTASLLWVGSDHLREYSGKQQAGELGLLTIGVWALLWLIYRGPYLFRNFVTREHDRVMYAWPNLDICPPCFATQELNALVFVTLLVVFWSRRLRVFEDIHSLLTEDEKSARGQEEAAEVAEEQKIPSVPSISEQGRKKLPIPDLALLVSNAFAQWQISSIVLVAGFLIYTEYFWNLVFEEGDSRYIFDAVIFHTVWAITWMIASLPLVTFWIAWKSRVAIELAATKRKSESQSEKNHDSHGITTLEELITRSPISIWNVALSAIIATLTFFGPVLHRLG